MAGVKEIRVWRTNEALKLGEEERREHPLVLVVKLLKLNEVQIQTCKLFKPCLMTNALTNLLHSPAGRSSLRSAAYATIVENASE
jgi:hypothetical protein